MESLQNIVRVIGVVARIGGLLWVLFAYMDLSSAKKNNDGQGQDRAIWGMVLGSSLAIFGPSMATAIGNEIAQITF